MCSSLGSRHDHTRRWDPAQGRGNPGFFGLAGCWPRRPGDVRGATRRRAAAAERGRGARRGQISHKGHAPPPGAPPCRRRLSVEPKAQRATEKSRKRPLRYFPGALLTRHTAQRILPCDVEECRQGVTRTSAPRDDGGKWRRGSFISGTTAACPRSPRSSPQAVGCRGAEGSTRGTSLRHLARRIHGARLVLEINISHSGPAPCTAGRLMRAPADLSYGCDRICNLFKA